MTSLKKRLLLALLLTVLLTWGIWFALLAVEMGRQQTGSWDSRLEEVAQKALLSIPGPMAPDADAYGYRLPDDMPKRADGLALQVWQLKGSPRLMLRSPEAPAEPMIADFDAKGFHDVELGGEHWRVYALHDRDDRIQVQLGQTQAQRRAEFHVWLVASLKAAALLFAVVSLMVFCVLNRGLRRLDDMRQLMRQRDPFDLTPLPQRDLPRELRPLIESVNRLLARLETALTRERRLIADAAHELRTPLAALTTQAELARGEADPGAKDAALDKLLQVARRATRLSEQLLDQARLDALERAPTADADLSALVVMVVRDHESVARARRQRVRLDVQPCCVTGDVDALGMLVSNLVDNALRYTPEQGQIDVSCGPRADGGAMLSVSDNGPGVPEADRERIFDRFYRAPGNGTRGSGIGLSLVAQIARLHGARIECGTGLEGRGFRIDIVFGKATGPAPAPDSANTQGMADAPIGAGAVPAAVPQQPGQRHPRAPAVTAHSSDMVLPARGGDPAQP